MTACQWQAVRSFARRRRPQGKGREANSELLSPGAHAWLARNAPAVGRHARPDLSRDKSGKDTLAHFASA